MTAGGYQLTMRDVASNRARSFVLNADVETPMADVLGLLARVYPGPVFHGETRLSARGTLGESGLRSGSVLTVGQPLAKSDRLDLEFVVTGGPGAGMHVPLKNGVTTVGRGPNAGIIIPDKNLAPVQFKLTVSGDMVSIQSHRGRGAVMIEGLPVEQPLDLILGEAAQAGATIFEVREPPQADANVHLDESGQLIFNRPARIQAVRPQTAFKLPDKPRPPEKRRFPWMQVCIPLVFAVLAAVLFHSPMFMLLALMSPVMAASSALGTKRDAKVKSKEETQRYESEMAHLTEQIADSALAQGVQRRLRLPDAASLGDWATLPMRRLWERRRHDPDFLTLRVGSVDEVADIRIEAGYNTESIDPPYVYCTPVGVSLPEVGVLGVAGDISTARAVGRWLVTQIATLHSPNDVRLFLLTEAGTKFDWEWMRWLPHTAMDAQPNMPYRSIAADQYTREAHVKLLTHELNERRRAQEHDEPNGPAIVVVYDGIRALRNVAGVSRLLKEGPGVGIYAIGLDSESSRLAQETKAEIDVDTITSGLGSLHRDGQEELTKVAIDQVTSKWAEQVARSLAPVVEAGLDEGSGGIPAYVRFVELVNLDLNNPDDVLSRWMLNGRSTSFVVGSSFDGPFSLDLKLDGPHGLVAGTTGAGKSEFLQTAIASLALANRPDALNFLLIDYKGASAFAACADLSHTVGLVTNLDGHQTMRALTALEAELQRREHILHDMQSSDVEIAWQRDPQRAAEEGLARLVIVIDEFAELIQEMPDFVNGLIRVARVGRSLGIHLILGTQRPSGVVSAEMRANTGLRIALRVEDRHDSTEVIDDPDAATISRSTPGRAYARLGGGGGLIPFQTARVAGRRPGASREIPQPTALPVKWEQLGRPLPVPRTSAVVDGDTTDLHAIVALINKAAVMINVAKPHSPWLPALGTQIAMPPPDVEMIGDAVYAVEDRPSEQAQRDVAFDIERGGHLLIAGAARSGRSTVLRTIAGTLANAWSPSDLHIHALDFGNGALLPLSSLPHAGVVTGRTETDRIERFVARLLEEIATRQAYLAAKGLGDISEQRQSSPRDEWLPYIAVLVDRWEGFVGEFNMDNGSDLPDQMMQIAREGLGVGIHLVLTGDRALLLDRISTQIEEKYIMRLNSLDDYALANVRKSDVPEDMPPGRAIAVGSLLHRQFLLLAGEPDAPAQAAALKNIGNIARRRWPQPAAQHTPIRVDRLPSTISLSEAEGMSSAISGANTALTPLLGVGGDTLARMHVDLLRDAPYFIIAGPSRSGRSNAAMVMAETMLRRGGGVIAITPRPSPLSDLANRERCFVFRGGPSDVSGIVDAVNSFDVPVCFLIDDSNALQGNVIDDLVKDVVTQNPAEVTAVIIGTVDEMKTQLYGLAAEARKIKAGMMFSPQYTLDGDMLGVRLPRNLTGRMTPGRAIFCIHGQATLLQVPLVETAESPPV